MFKLPNRPPTLNSSEEEWADYAEYIALQKGKVSAMSLVKAPLLASDELDVLGVDDDTDYFKQKSEETISEIVRRRTICNELYPFSIDESTNLISYTPGHELGDIVYRYLLLATRNNMKNSRVYANIDGALLFERLCASVAKNYFGEFAEVEVMGTSKSNAGNFRDTLQNLTIKMREGGSIRLHPDLKPQDDKLDIVVWKGFSDNKTSQLIAFGQCKTGTSWRDHLSELQSDVFCKKWFTIQPVHTPLRLFFCAQYFPRDLWEGEVYSAGLLFDRFRIIDYLPDVIEDDLLEEMSIWTDAAFKNYNP